MKYTLLKMSTVIALACIATAPKPTLGVSMLLGLLMGLSLVVFEAAVEARTLERIKIDKR